MYKVSRKEGKITITDAISGNTLLSFDEDAILIASGEAVKVSGVSDSELLQYLTGLGMLKVVHEAR
ncbi:MAG: hypothetical protein AAB225_04025 [Acidobacteriota bacterium]